MRIRAKVIVLVSLAALPMHASTQQPFPLTTMDAVKSFGLSDDEVQRIRSGAIISKGLKEESDKELAGVVAIFFEQPLIRVAGLIFEGNLVKSDPSVRTFYSWTPCESVDKAFGNLKLDANETDESSHFLQAAPGTRLNLAEVEIQRFRLLKARQAINRELQTMLRTRYEDYRKGGLKSILPYARAGNTRVPAGEELAMAISETTGIERVPGFSKALLNYPADSLPDMQHRFFAYKQEVDGRPAFILSHRASLQNKQEALITEQRYYVSHTYNCRFIASNCVEVPGGTLLFYFNRTFTDQVAGLGSGLKHSIGRQRMLSDVASSLKDFRETIRHMPVENQKP